MDCEVIQPDSHRPTLYDPLRGTWLVVAHPDDETIGAASMIMDGRVGRIVHVTDGAPRKRALWGQTIARQRGEYALVRRAELEAALRAAHFPRGLGEVLGTTDQEAVQDVVRIVGMLVPRFLTYRPEAVVTHAFEGAHPDHDATAVAVQAAAALVRVRGVKVRVLEMAAGSFAATGCSPAIPPAIEANREWVRLLTGQERRVKASMLACFGTQRLAADAPYLRAERFRDAPAYDFSRPPRSGTLEYVERGWCAWPRFQELILGALEQLGLSSSPLSEARKVPTDPGDGPN